MSSTINPRKRPAESQEDAWVANEDKFVLQQARKKAALRIKSGRAQPIDFLAATLHTIDATRSGFEDDEDDDQDPLVINPESVFEGLSQSQLQELETGIDTYLALEKSRSNYEFWQTMKLVCKDRQQTANGNAASGRGLSSVASELDRVLAPKNLVELEALEKQVRHKLRTDDSIDVDYWESLLKRLSVHKARAKLRQVSQEVIGARTGALRKQQEQDANKLQSQIREQLSSQLTSSNTRSTQSLDPEPALKIDASDKAWVVVDEESFKAQILAERQKVMKAGFIPARKSETTRGGQRDGVAGSHEEDISRANITAYEREVARGVGENEEVFATEEDLGSSRKLPWAEQYRPRKPRYFNRVQTGYEWNKYNQTHYDQDNPPPKIVQGYRFNIFYPDLVDKTKAPTYRIERENGRKRGQTFAPAGEDDTCVIRFIAGAPYEDIAFKIIDREWDYSAKRERGFKSSFDKGILQLHFGFKKIYYRK